MKKLKITARVPFRFWALALTALFAVAAPKSDAQVRKGFMLATTGHFDMLWQDINRVLDPYQIGASIVRFPIYLSVSEDIDGYWMPRIVAAMGVCQSRNAILVLDLHHPNTSEYAFNPNTGQMEHYGQGIIIDPPAFVERWRYLANRFRGQPNIWFDLCNEPRLLHGVLKNWSWQKVARSAVYAIRKVDPTRPFVYALNGSTTRIPTNFTPLLNSAGVALTNQIVEAHFWNWGDKLQLPGAKYPNPAKGYTREAMKDELRPLRDMRTRYGTPILIGEVGFRADSIYCAPFLRDFTQVSTGYGFSTILHAYNEAPIWRYEVTPTWDSVILPWLRS